MSKFPKLEWEKEAGEALDYIEKNISEFCGEALEHLVAAAGAAGGAAYPPRPLNDRKLDDYS
jgi:hypothetical protein